jgi:hypothetical protein
LGGRCPRHISEKADLAEDLFIGKLLDFDAADLNIELLHFGAVNYNFDSARSYIIKTPLREFDI